MVSRDCPISLNCDFFDDCRNYCETLARPWPLPFSEYIFDSKWRELFGFEVQIPGFREPDSNNDWEIIYAERHNTWAAGVRQELWLAGWWKAINLPYKYHSDGGIEVIYHLPLDEEVMFACPWAYHPKGYLYAAPTHWEGFMPPIPVNSCTHEYWADEIEADGFYKDWLIWWPSDFYGREDE